MGEVFHVLTTRPRPQRLSLVIAAYNEQEVLPMLRREVTAFMDDLPGECEVVIVNDGSSDRTLEMLLAWASEDSRVKVIGLARNFGHQVAVTAGLDAATGDAVVIMDADLQDPLETVHRMIDKYCEGYDVVYGRRISRAGDSIFKRFTAWAFYRLMQRFVHKDLPLDSGDFRLISRPCLDALKQMRETHRFLRGMVAWVGFPQTAVEFERAPRAAGTTKYSLIKMLRFAWTAAVSFGPAPLRVSLVLGALVSLGGFAYGGYAVWRVLTGRYVEPGWTSMLVVTCLIGGGILIGIGVLGEYIARIFEEVKGRPLYVVSTRANVKEPDSATSDSTPGGTRLKPVIREIHAEPESESETMTLRR